MVDADEARFAGVWHGLSSVRVLCAWI
jgi:hypothetical protein